MVKQFAPVGSALPPRRGDVMVAAAASSVAETRPDPIAMHGGSIIVPEAQDRMLELIEREQLPQDVRSTLSGALLGDLHRQQLLFQAMIDTWPRLQKAMREVALAARRAPWKVEPWAPRGEKADAKSETLAKEVENAVWSMKPDMARGLKGFEGTVEELAKGYFLGHQVLEVNWWQQPMRWQKAEGTNAEVRRGGDWAPKNTKIVPPRFYGYPSWDEKEDRLMLDTDGGKSGVMNYVDFPAHKFLIGVNGGHPGHPTIAAPLRALTGFWLAAVYGLKWLMQYAQLYGIPFRWAEYTAGDETAKANIVKMMRTIGSEGWAAFPTGTKMNFLDSNKGGSSLVQKALLDLADEQCDIFILGQTLTSSQGERGSQSLGEVHMSVRQEVVEGVCDFVGEILTYQLSGSYVAVNYGERDDVPGIWAKFEKPKDEKGMAERDQTLGLLDGTFPVEKQWMYERHGVPLPAEGADLFKDEPEPVDPLAGAIGPDGKPLPPKPGAKRPETRDQKEKKVEAADATITWRQFPASYGSLGIPRAEMPQIKAGDRAAMVLFFRKREIGSDDAEVQADTLKPAQAEYSPEKAMAAGEHGGNRSIIVSEDGYVVDGHHQWYDALVMGRNIRVIRLKAPISRVLMMAHRMPSTSVAASRREDLDPDADADAEAAEMLAQMEKLSKGGLVDVDAAAAALAAAWVEGAKKD